MIMQKQHYLDGGHFVKLLLTGKVIFMVYAADQVIPLVRNIMQMI